MSSRPPKQLKWLSRTVVGIGLASLFSDLSHEAVTAVLPAYLASLGAAAGALGTVEGVADGLSSAAKLYGGWLSDRLHRRKPLCVGGYTVMAFAPLVIAAASSWVIVLVGRSVAWVSRGLRTPPRKALLSEAVPKERLGRAFGFERAMDTLGAIIAPLAALWLLHLGVKHRTIIFVSFAPALAAALCIMLLVKETPGRHPVRRPLLQTFGGFGSRFNEFLAAVGLFGLGDFADSLFILYTVGVLAPEIGAAKAATASVALYALHNVFYAALSYAGGWASDFVSKRLMLGIGYAAAACAALCAAAQVHSLFGLAMMFVLAGSGVGIYEAVEDALAADILPREVRGSGYGALAVVTGIGDMLSSLTVGWLWMAFGSGTAFGCAAGCMIAGIALLAHLSRRS